MKYRIPQELAASAAARTVDSAVLRRVLTLAEQVGAGGVVVFDLDSTLLDNRPRQARILREYGAAIADPRLAACAPDHWEGWSIQHALRNCGLSAAEVAQHAGPAKAYWLERFFTSPYCVDDITTPGAVAYVEAVLQRGAQVAYCTGRHVEMGEGTLACFAREGFPLPDERRVHLLLKPTFSMHDDRWKEVAYAKLRALGTVLAAFDNEPTHINGYHQEFPEALAVHLLTDESGRGVPVLPTIPSIHDFVL